jgi:cellulose synthase (UDP-forming)
MTPGLLLSLWRERWGKPDIATFEQPYESGAVTDWSDKVNQSTLWGVPGLGLAVMILFASTVAFVATLRFVVLDQLWFSLLLLTPALLLRGFQGGMITLVLMWLSIISTTRYFYWRFDATLGTSLNGEFFLALGLLGVELYGASLFTAGIGQLFWPATKPQENLANDQDEWPKIGVFVLCADQSIDRITQSLQHSQAINWPKNKITLCFVDTAERDEVRQLLSAQGAKYLAGEQGQHGVAQLVNQALSASKDTLTVVLQADKIPDPNFLQECVAWFQSDPKLAALSTPQHVLMPPPGSAFTSQFETRVLGGEFMLLRCASFMQTPGLPIEPLSSRKHFAETLNKAGFDHAYVTNTSDESYCRVDNPLQSTALRFKLMLAWCREVLLFYRFLLGFVALGTPLIYLLTEISPLKTSPLVFLAMVLPHWIQAGLLSQRVNKPKILPLWLDALLIVMTFYIWLLTTFTASFTKIRQLVTAMRKTSSKSAAPLTWPLNGLDTGLLIVHGMALVFGLKLCLQADYMGLQTAIFYMTWSAGVVMLMVAKLAVAEETNEIRWQAKRQMRMAAMLKLPNNRTLACQTANFPHTTLELITPAALQIKPGEEVKVSIFHTVAEFAFAATVLTKTDRGLRIDVDTADVADFNAFAKATCARGPDWPQWLAGQNVAHILPAWLMQFFEYLFTKFMKMFVRLEKMVRKNGNKKSPLIWKKKT